MPGSIDADLEALITLEQRLLEPAVRRDRPALEQLLHEDFTEFGASGRVYDREGIIATLLASDGATAAAYDFNGQWLSPDVALLTYRTEASLRTSIWCREQGAPWQILHHQGTPVTG